MSAEQSHGERAHALLSPSGASRWIACPPSARLEDAYPRETSAYADEGTLAHEIAEAMLSDPGGRNWEEQFEGFRLNSNYYDGIMGDLQPYSDYIHCLEGSVQALKVQATAHVEGRFSLNHIIPNSFGTCDYVIVGRGFIHVVDLKFGKGVRVEAKDNSQLKLYALAAAWHYDADYTIEDVTLHIVQPRIGNFSAATYKLADLEKWADEVVRPAALLAHEGKGEFKTGSHCRFCKAKAECRALADECLEAAKDAFEPTTVQPNLMGRSELIEAYGKADIIRMWLDAVEARVVGLALGGEKIQGYKLVEGRSVRRWADDKEAAKTLISLGCPRESVITEKTVGIGDAEKAYKKLKLKDKFDEAMKAHLIKPAGKPTLVVESDNRKALEVSKGAEYGELAEAGSDE